MTPDPFALPDWPRAATETTVGAVAYKILTEGRVDGIPELLDALRDVDRHADVVKIVDAVRQVAHDPERSWSGWRNPPSPKKALFQWQWLAGQIFPVVVADVFDIVAVCHQLASTLTPAAIREAAAAPDPEPPNWSVPTEFVPTPPGSEPATVYGFTFGDHVGDTEPGTTDRDHS